MSTKQDVMNDALIIMGEPPINDASDPNNASRTLLAAWRGAVKTCFEIGAWNFAQKNVQLARLADKPAFGYAYYYQLPSDYMRLVFISETGSEENPLTRYSDQAVGIATDAETVFLRYVSEYYVDRVGDWPQVFADYVAAELAMRTQPRLHPTESARELCKDERKRRRRVALAFDAQQNPPGRWPQGSWSRARSRGHMPFTSDYHPNGRN